MKYCPYCGAGLQSDMIFCPRCGKRFNDAVENEKLSLSPEDSGDSPNKGEVECQRVVAPIEGDIPASIEITPAEVPEKSKGKKPWWIAVVAGVAGIACVILLIVFGFDWSKAGNENAVTEAGNSVLYLEVYDEYGDIIATASGFIIGDGVTLVTNYHVIDGAYRIVVRTPDGEKSVDIHTVLSYDETADLAVLLCEKDVGVKPLVLGNSDEVKQGDTVYAVGYPLGVAHTMSDGIVSSRYIDEYGVDVLQITAAISSGSSGGALLDEAGTVIGVICASYVEGQNLNLAIAESELEELLGAAMKAVPLAELYEASDHPRTVRDILLNHDKLDGQYVYVKGYLSSAFAYSAGESSVVDYYFVSTPDEVLGYNYSNKLYDLDEFISCMREENQRDMNYGLIMVEIAWENRFDVLPGDLVIIYGKVNDYDNLKSLLLDDCVLIG